MASSFLPKMNVLKGLFLSYLKCVIGFGRGILKMKNEENIKKIQNLTDRNGKRNSALLRMLYFASKISRIADKLKNKNHAKELYEYKNDAIALALQNDKQLFNISVFINDGTKTGATLCKQHYFKFRNEWNSIPNHGPYGKQELIDYYNNTKELQDCPICTTTYGDNYYSLYDVEFKYKTFSAIFNVPVPLRDRLMPKEYQDLDKITKVNENQAERCYELRINAEDKNFEKFYVEEFKIARDEYKNEISKQK